MNINLTLALVLAAGIAHAGSYGMSEKECKAAGGRVAGDYPPECTDKELSLGPVRMKCPCTCCAPAKEPRVATKKPLEALREISAPDKKIYGSIRDARDWRNPQLVVGVTDIRIVDRNSVEVEGLISRLAKLPKDAWPYGRIVLIMENPIRSKGDTEKIKKNLNRVLEELKDAGIQADQWLSALTIRLTGRRPGEEYLNCRRRPASALCGPVAYP